MIALVNFLNAFWTNFYRNCDAFLPLPSQNATQNGGGGGGGLGDSIGWISGEDLNTDGEESFGREEGHRERWPKLELCGNVSRSNWHNCNCPCKIGPISPQKCDHTCIGENENLRHLKSNSLIKVSHHIKASLGNVVILNDPTIFFPF